MDPKIKRVIRTVLQGVVTAAVLLPLAVTQAGVSVDWAWLTATLGALGVIARLMQTPAAEALLRTVGLSLADPDAGVRGEYGDDTPPNG